MFEVLRQYAFERQAYAEIDNLYIIIVIMIIRKMNSRSRRIERRRWMRKSR